MERGNRVFPRSDRASDIIDALFQELKRLKVPVIHERASEISIQDGAVRAVEVRKDKGRTGFGCKAVILATGGVSYPATGSTGDGYRMADGWATPLWSRVPRWFRWCPQTPAADRCRD